MRYFVIAAKHHDGFALWPTRASTYNVMDAGPLRRDLLGELAVPCSLKQAYEPRGEAVVLVRPESGLISRL